MMEANELRSELTGLRLELCQEVQRNVAEGRYHNGPSTTTQLLGFKI